MPAKMALNPDPETRDLSDRMFEWFKHPIAAGNRITHAVEDDGGIFSTSFGAIFTDDALYFHEMDQALIHQGWLETDTSELVRKSIRGLPERDQKTAMKAAREHIRRAGRRAELNQIRAERAGVERAEVARQYVDEDLRTKEFDDDLPSRKKPSKETKVLLYNTQNKKCGGCGLVLPERNLTVDHIKPRSKGGGDEIENLQLLCSHCNSIKGSKSQEALMLELRKRGIIK